MFRAEWFGILPDLNVDITHLFQKANDSLSEGSVIDLLPGKYLVRHVNLKPNTTWKGNHSVIKQIGNDVVFECIGGWSKKGVSVTSIETVSQVFDGLNYFVSKITCDTTGIFKNDIVKIYSRDLIPNSSIGARYLGEFGTVASVGSGFILLNSTLEDIYTNNVMIGVLKGDSITVDGFSFVGPDDIVVPSSSGSGGGAPIRFSSLEKPRIINCTVKETISNGVVMHSCYGYNIDNLRAIDLPSLPDQARYGYGVCDANSDFGVVSSPMGRNVRHLFTTNTYSINSDITNPANYGRSKDFKVVDGNCYGGATAHYDTHDGALRGEFIDCLSQNSNWRSDMAEPGTSSAAIQLRSNARVIGGGSDSDCGIKVFTPEGQNGGDNYNTKVKGVLIDNYKCNFKRNALELNNAEVTISDCLIERAKGINYGNSDTQKASVFTLSRQSVLNVKAGNIIDRGINSQNLVTDNNSSIYWDGGTIDLTEVILNDSLQQVNYDYRIFYCFNVFVNNNIYFNNVNLLLNDRIIDALARSSSSANLINFTSKGTKVFVTASSKTISTGDSFTRRIIGGSFSDIRYAIGFLDSKVGISDLTYYNIESGLEQSYNYNIQSTSIIQTYGRSDKSIFVGILPPTDAFMLTDIKAGVFVGQLVVLRNTHASRTVILPNLTNTSISSDVTILPKREYGLRWSGSLWEPATTLNISLPTNYLTTDSVQSVQAAAAKVFYPGSIYLDGPSTGSVDLPFRSNSIVRWFLRLTDILSPGSNNGANLQFVARNDDGTFLGMVATLYRKSKNIVFGEDTTDSPSALVSMNSTTKGFVKPRMTTAQRDAILTPTLGMEISNLDTGKPNFYTGSYWAGIDGDVLSSTIYNPSNGVFITTSISAETLQFLTVEVKGNNYNLQGKKTIYSFFQARNNLGTIDNTGGVSNGFNLSIDLFIYNGFVCAFLPFIANFFTYNITINSPQGANRGNLITSVKDLSKPVTGVTSNVSILSDPVASIIKVANTTDVITQSFLNSTYPLAFYPIDTVVKYYNLGKTYTRVTATLWDMSTTNLLS